MGTLVQNGMVSADACLAMQVSSLSGSQQPAGDGITIRERPAANKENEESVSAEEKQRQADADYARQLQAKLDAQELRGGSRCIFKSWGAY